jgi:hypothetical protein
VRVVEVQPQVVVRGDELVEFRDRREIRVHAVETVRGVPHPPVCPAVFVEAALQGA